MRVYKISLKIVVLVWHEYNDIANDSDIFLYKIILFVAILEERGV